MKKVGIIFGAGIGLMHLADYLDNKSKNHKLENSRISKEKNIVLPSSFPLTTVFQAEKFMMREQFKQKFHLSTPFNRKVNYIYNLPFYYIEYENYNFNKLSDLFLNIHIFIN